MIKEIEQRKHFIGPDLKTIYLGGGTPSLLPIEQLRKLFTTIRNNFDISHTEEITLEINSEDASMDYLKALFDIGINRLSIGVESFDDGDLKFLNRSHTSYQAHRAIENAKASGFENISIDLICNLPVSDFEKWQNNLRTAIGYGIPHISCYTLMIEEGTMLNTLIERGKYTPKTESSSLEEFDYTMQELERCGYVHYETSSYAKDGYQSKHNMAYWTFKPYLGIGAGAHSYNNNTRMWNENNVSAYMNRILSDSSGQFPEKEILSTKDEYNEYVMLSARMNKKLDAAYVKNKFPQYAEHFAEKLQELVNQQFFNADYSFTTKGWHLQDFIILELAV